jgi:hypothetical protein
MIAEIIHQSDELRVNGTFTPGIVNREAIKVRG